MRIEQRTQRVLEGDQASSLVVQASSLVVSEQHCCALGSALDRTSVQDSRSASR
jgi:hypothetical protein